VTPSVSLLGRPRIEPDGLPTGPPRGNKAWALLAYLALSDRPPTRQHLVSLLFGEAADPLGALRWNVAELRRALRGVATLDGDPLVLTVEAECEVDVRRLTDGGPTGALDLDDVGHELLEGLSFPSAPAFEAWLAAERCRIAGCTQAVLVERTLDLLADGSPGAAVAAARLAARAVAADPLDADAHSLLVRSLTAAGDRAGARRQAARCTELFRRELGCAPPAEVTAASEPAAVPRLVTAGPAAVHSYLDAGRASLAAGAVPRALEQLDRAAGMAVELGNPQLRAAAFVALGGARIHGAGERGTGVRGLLQEAVSLARTAGADDLAAAACRELGFLAVQRGHGDRALVWLDRAGQLATEDAERARLLGVRGMCLTDTADYPGAMAALAESMRLAGRVGDPRQRAWSLSMVGRIHVLRGEPARAAGVLDTALAEVAGQGWTAFLPWLESWRAEAATGLGDTGTAGELLDHAWVLATESGDHCWLAVVASGHARLALAEGSPARAGNWCDQGLAPAPWYLWPHARLLDAACAVALVRDPPASVALTDRLAEVAGRGNMRDLLVRAHLHRARAGSRTSLATARALATEIDDPVLHARLGDRSPPAERRADVPGATGSPAGRKASSPGRRHGTS
jgi:DNA-binding SARP family transcriptional activator